METQERTKICKDCKGEKPLSEFYRMSGMRDGRYPQCKICWNHRISVWKSKNRDKVRKYDKRKRDKRRAKEKKEKKYLTDFLKNGYIPPEPPSAWGLRENK